jgi:tricorn protease interacting factor F2/3
MLELDAVNLSIQSTDAGGTPVSFALDGPGSSVRLSGIPQGATAVTIAFSGRIDSQSPKGLYRSPLGDGELLTTQFEPVDARRMFPCRDRPDAKAVFVLEVVAPPGLTVLSNMPSERSDTTGDGRQRVRFAPTPPMSTYLLYLGVGPFEEVEGISHGHRVITATARGVSAKTEPLLLQSARALDYFSEYYGIPYPLPKLHVVAIPKFLSGAMENWGAITCAEPFLLMDDRTPMTVRQLVYTMLFHEIAHQWFGNLVTMRSWNDLWLNESFATFVSYKARSKLFPDWKSWEDFLHFYYGEAILFDSLSATHPIHVEVTDPNRVAEFFDEISYGKGASVLRMVESYLGEEAFREGVSLYLREHQWGNAEAQDLWNSLARASSEPIDRVMPDWIRRPGFPVIRARLEGESLVLEQRRFSLMGSRTEAPWPIPLTFELDGCPHRRLMVESSLRLPATGASRVLIGPGRTGFYRVRYEGRLWDRLLDAYSGLLPTDRWGILDDSRAFLLAGEIGLPEYLDLLGRVVHETDSLVVNQAYDSLEQLFTIAHQIPAWEAMYRKIFVAQTERLGFTPRPGEPDADASLRERVVRARVALDPPFARELAGRYHDLEKLAPEVTGPVLMAYAATAGPAEYAELRRRFREAPPGPSAREVAAAMAFLGRDEWLGECLDLLGTGEMQQSAWMRLVQMALWLNPDRSGGFWSFLTGRLGKALPNLSEAGVVGYLLKYAVPMIGVTRPELMRRWVVEHPVPGGEEGAKKGLELLNVFVRTLDRAQ